MRPMRVLRFLVLNGFAVGLGAVVATSCIDVDYPTVAFRCNPRQSDNCPETHTCCSDDPSAVGGVLPAYQNKEIEGDTPFFSGLNNALGTSGMCVRTGDIPSGSGLLEAAAANCPIPCNPSWSDSDELAVCGANRVCCQTVELEPEDCVQEDPDDPQSWRPAVGTDIFQNRTNWDRTRHVTHQDAGGEGCSQFSTDNGDPEEDPGYRGCLEQLTVADQRGFCIGLEMGQGCPTEAPDYVNACDQINLGQIPPPIAGAAAGA